MSDDEEFEIYRGPKMGYDAPKERVPFVARAQASFFGSPFVPRGAKRENVHRWVQGGTLSVSSKSARLEIQVETSFAEIAGVGLGAGVAAAVTGAAAVAGAAAGVAGRARLVRVALPPRRVERVVIDRNMQRIAIKATAELGEKELPAGWFGMALHSLPEDLIPALRDAFGDKVQEGPLKTDNRRMLVMLAVLVALVVFMVIVIRPS